MFEAMLPKERVIWVTTILQFCVRSSAPTPPIERLLAIAQREEQWSTAREAFNDLRSAVLAAERSVSEASSGQLALLNLAETVAKVVHNASGALPPFDQHAGWRIGPQLHAFLSTVGEPAVVEAGELVLLTNPMKNAA
jgi:hypothetical protein